MREIRRYLQNKSSGEGDPDQENQVEDAYLCGRVITGNSLPNEN